MSKNSTPDYQCGELRISPARGLVSNGRGGSTRLGPVNMKVLAALLARPGQMLSRSEIFDLVWPNQVVSDDALTRCVSDIRGELRKLSGCDDWIETLPKRGYRWTAQIAEAVPAEINTESNAPAEPPSPIHPGQRALRLASRGIGYLLALVVMGSAMVWSIDHFTEPRAPVVAVLPASADPASAAAAAEFDQALRASLTGLGTVRVLARSAVDSRPPNPYPFFHYEFEARWVIEAGLRASAGQTLISIGVADARTGIVEMQFSESIAAGGVGGDLFSEHAREVLREFIELQMAH